MKVKFLGAGRIGAFRAGVLAEHEDVDALLIGDIDAVGVTAVAKEVGGQPRPLKSADNPRVLHVLRGTDHNPKQ